MPNPVLCACTVLGLTAALGGIAAAVEPGLYAEIGLGGALYEDIHGSVAGIPAVGETDPGIATSAALGYRFANGIRLQGEFLYAQANLKALRFPAAIASLSGTVDLFSFTAGGFYELELWPGLSPYAGAGLGVVLESSGPTAATLAGATTVAPGGDSTNFTAFGEVGLAWSMTARSQLVSSYRFQWIQDGAGGFEDTRMHVLRLGWRLSL